MDGGYDNDQNAGGDYGGSRSFGGSRGGYGQRSAGPHRDQKSDGYRLHVANIPDSMGQEDIQQAFSNVGTVKEVWITSNADSPKFGFVVYEDQASAESAIESMNNSDLGGSQIRVSWARPREDRGGRGGRRGGGYGGGRGGYGGNGGGYGGGGFGGGGVSYDSGSRACFNCGRPGHLARDCRSGGGGDGGQRSGGYGGGGRGGGGFGGPR